MRREAPKFVRYCGVAPSWDNTARRQKSATIYVDASPLHYHRWLEHARAHEAAARGANGLVFINAWNEWAEGAYLEPDLTHGLSYLNATLKRPTQPLGDIPRARLGLVSVSWTRSILLTAAGSLLQLNRRITRLGRAVVDKIRPSNEK